MIPLIYYLPSSIREGFSFLSALLVSLVFGIVIPFIVMTMLVPSLQAKAPKTHNFRGREVFNGLGVVWFIWLASIYLALQFIEHFTASAQIWQDVVWQNSSWLSLLQPVIPLLAGTVAFGLFDDWAGDSAAKGFKGHFRALGHGKLTTGGLKMIGIGLIALACGISVFYNGSLVSFIQAALAGAVMALSANLMNLFDLRPGRASKVYTLVLLLVTVVWLIAIKTGSMYLNCLGLVAIALACIGPVVATLRFDLREDGMLGDAGANSMGALLGYLAVLALPLWALVVVTVFLVFLNLLSERVSFSDIIAKYAWLNKLDELGRKHKDNG